MMKKLFLALFLIVLLALGGIFYFYKQASGYQNRQAVTLYFPKGSTLKKISKTLAENSVVYHALYFELLARLTKNDRELKYGEYELEGGITAQNILEKMKKGLVKLYSLPIPEGYTAKEIAGTVMKNTVIQQADQFQNLLRDPQLFKKLNIPINNIEGYLFPDTYRVDRETSASELLNSMIALLEKNITPAMLKTANDKGLSRHQLLTLASIVEKETGKASERAVIASVFFNRLKINMPLQSDPTVIYGIANFNGNLTRNNLLSDHPYNTYTRGGVPIGPICSPGLDAINAVLNPAETDYLYFVGKGDGSHYFSKTLDEHNQAVRYYQLKQGNPPGE